MTDRHAGDGGDLRGKSIARATRGDASSRNEKSGNLASCLLVGAVLFRPLAIRPNISPDRRGRDTPGSQKAPSTKRCIKTATEVAQASNPKTVRKHRAPNGALRRRRLGSRAEHTPKVRKHRAPNGALRLVFETDGKCEGFTSESTERQTVH